MKDRAVRNDPSIVHAQLTKRSTEFGGPPPGAGP